LVTSNLPFDEWTSVLGSERLTGALLDRLTHHVHIRKRRGGDTSQFDWLRGAFVDQDGWPRRRLTRCF